MAKECIFKKKVAGTTNSNGNHHNADQGHSNTNGVSSDERHFAVLLRNCCFARNPKIPVTLNPSDQKNVSLVDISLAIRRGELVGVIGKNFLSLLR